MTKATNFSDRPRPGVEKRHNTELEHKIIGEWEMPRRRLKLPPQQPALRTTRPIITPRAKARSRRDLTKKV